MAAGPGRSRPAPTCPSLDAQRPGKALAALLCELGQLALGLDDFPSRSAGPYPRLRWPPQERLPLGVRSRLAQTPGTWGDPETQAGPGAHSPQTNPGLLQNTLKMQKPLTPGKAWAPACKLVFTGTCPLGASLVPAGANPDPRPPAFPPRETFLGGCVCRTPHAGIFVTICLGVCLRSFFFFLFLLFFF